MTWTLSTLKTAIQDYCETSETIENNNLSVFIKEAEERILKNVEIPDFRKNVTGTATASNTYLSMPSDFLAPLSLAVISSSVYTYLYLKHVSFIRDYTPNSATTGAPIYYGLFDSSTFILAPTPDANYSFELHYKYRPASLTAGSDSGTTWLSTNAPNALLYGSLAEASTFIKTPEETGYYDQRFQEALAGLKKLGEGYGIRDEYRYDISRMG